MARPPAGHGPIIQSLQRGFAILETVAQHPPGVTMAEVSRATGLHASTTHHLLRTLVALGYLVQAETTRQYRLGPRAFRVAAAGWGEAQLSEAAGPFLAELARTTGETSHLAVLERGEVVVLNKVDGSSPVRLAERVGYPRPAHCTAIGKVLLASLPERDLGAFLEDTELRPMTPKTITSPSRLAAELRRVRAKGHALDDEEFTQGIRQVVAAVGISGPIWRVSLERAAGLARTVSAAAGRLSQHLGGRPGSREDAPAPHDGITPRGQRARPSGNGGRT